MNEHNLDYFINDILESELSSKQQQVVADRFGLDSGERMTLQAVGDKLDITRERVRQIENQALESVSSKIKKRADTFIKAVLVYMKSVGGVKRDDYFMNDLANLFFKGSDYKKTEARLRFLFSAVDKPLFYKEDDDYYSFWYLDEKEKKDLFDFLKKAKKSFEKGKRDDFFKSKTYLSLCPDFRACHQMMISKHVDTNPFGEVGLVSWPEIRPKNIRDKIQLVLKKNENPIHFRDIAKLINEHGLGNKKAHPQTVHNELIKDDRFVLVGRGSYALEEYGYEPGTAREVVARIIKKNGPLKPDEVVKLVQEKKLLKENTVLINLQNRRYFKRNKDGRYRLV